MSYMLILLLLGEPLQGRKVPLVWLQETGGWGRQESATGYVAESSKMELRKVLVVENDHTVLEISSMILCKQRDHEKRQN